MIYQFHFLYVWELGTSCDLRDHVKGVHINEGEDKILLAC